jgi:hypothetical protein
VLVEAHPEALLSSAPDSKPLSRHELEVLVHEAGGELVTDMSAAVAAAEQGAAAAAAAAAAPSAGGLQLSMPVQPAPRPTLYVLASGRDAAEVAELAVSLQALEELRPAAMHSHQELHSQCLPAIAAHLVTGPVPLQGRAGVLVLRPHWLLDSISAMRILPTRAYQLGS